MESPYGWLWISLNSIGKAQDMAIKCSRFNVHPILLHLLITYVFALVVCEHLLVRLFFGHADDHVVGG